MYGVSIGSSDSSLPEFSILSESDLSFISKSESITDVSNVRELIRQNDTQELRLLNSAKRAIDLSNDPWESIKRDQNLSLLSTYK